jgi:hypothetical protein
MVLVSPTINVSAKGNPGIYFRAAWILQRRPGRVTLRELQKLKKMTHQEKPAWVFAESHNAN